MSVLEAFVDTLRLFPLEFSRHFQLLTDLDLRFAKLRTECQTLEDQLIDTLNSNSLHGVNNVIRLLKKIRHLQKEQNSFSGEKYELSTEAISIVKSYINRLEEDMKLFEQEYPEAMAKLDGGNINTDNNNNNNNNNLNNGILSYEDTRRNIPSLSSSSIKGYKQQKSRRDFDMKSIMSDSAMDDVDENSTNQNNAPELTFNDAEAVPISNEQLGMDMSVDQAKEELFCICQQPSYGEMVACDDENCKYEWFHYECVGLKKQPKGEWYCPDCSLKHQRQAPQH